MLQQNYKECRHPTCGSKCRRKKGKNDKFYKLKRTPIAKISKKRKNLGRDTTQKEADWAFFLEIWGERPHICFESQEALPNEPLTLFFHHVLEKGIKRYKKYRYCKWNIVLISWEVHSKCHNNIDFAPKVKAYYDLLLKILDKHGDITEELINKQRLCLLHIV